VVGAGGVTVVPASIFASMRDRSAVAYRSSNAEGSKSATIDSTSDDAIASSCGRTLTGASRIGKSAARTSSGHNRVCRQMTPPRTRSTPIDSR